MKEKALLKRVLASPMDENLRDDLVRKLLGVDRNVSIGVPRLKDFPKALNSSQVLQRMKSVAGGTGASVARRLGVSSQAFHNQFMRGTITAKGLINLHLLTGFSLDWLAGSWDGREDSYEYVDLLESGKDKPGSNVNKKNLSLVETYNQHTGQTELKWCRTKYAECRDEEDMPIPDDFGVLLSLINRYKFEAGTPEKVKNGIKKHFQVRKVLAYVQGDPKTIARLDGQAKKLTEAYLSEQGERPGKTEFRVQGATVECLNVLRELAEMEGLLVVIEPSYNHIAWDYLIGAGSMSPEDWVLGIWKDSRRTV